MLRFEQVGDVFDLPVTVSLQYADGSSSDMVVSLTERVTELQVPISSPVRRVEVNRDDAAPARFERRPGP